MLEPQQRRGDGSVCARGPRFLLYSHDTTGLGNIRRTLALASLLAREYVDALILIVTGSPVVPGLSIPPRTDYVKLPSLDRTGPYVYRARALGALTEEMKRARRNMLTAAVQSFDPDLFLVDKQARGIGGELMPAIRALHRRGRARLVLGLRDVLDDHWGARRFLRRSRSFEVVERYYDEVWIYGCASVFDPTKEYAFPDPVIRKTRFCGYLEYPTQASATRMGRPGVLVTVGGGQDGSALVQSYLEGVRRCEVPDSLRTRVVFGPQMDASTRASLRERYGNGAVHFEDFTPEMSRFYAEADAVVAMAGYGTVCELLSNGCPAVLVPRSEPVREQLIRARRLSERGLFGLVEPDELTPERLIEKLFEELGASPRRREPVDLGGLGRVRDRVRALLGGEVA